MTNLIKQKTKALVINRATNYALIFLIFAAVIFYAYSASAAVRSLATLEKTKQQTQSLSVKVSEMESRRLSLENDMSTKVALQLGFVEVINPTFIVKNSRKVTLSLKTD